MQYICFLIIGILLYSCCRGHEEIAFCQVDEFAQINKQSILFQMKRDYKSHKLDAFMNVVHKPSHIIPGKKFVFILRLLKDKCKPGKNLNHLFLKPLPSAKSSSGFFWGMYLLVKLSCTSTSSSRPTPCLKNVAILQTLCSKIIIVINLVKLEHH